MSQFEPAVSESITTSTNDSLLLGQVEPAVQASSVATGNLLDTNFIILPDMDDESMIEMRHSQQLTQETKQKW